MTLNFTETELKWINRKMFNWSLKENCPKKLRKQIQAKLDILNKKSYSYERGFINAKGRGRKPR